MADGFELDVTEEDPRRGDRLPSTPPTPRPALQVYFQCANAYQKVLRAVDGHSYTARCPKCGMIKQFVVGPGGSDQRTFRLSCQ